MFIILAVLFCIISIALMIMSRRVTPLPSTWSTFTVLSAVLSAVGYLLPKLTTFWLIVALFIWIITAVIVVRSKFKVNKAKLAMIVMTIVLVIIAIYAPKVDNHKMPVANKSATVEPTKTNSLEKAKEVLKNGGWKEDEYVLQTVDPQKDKSTTGDGAFNKEGIKNTSELITFLKSGKPGAFELTTKIMKDASVSKEVVLDPENWVAVQSNVPFSYPGNTGLKGGEIINVGSKDGSTGDIFMLFISPISDKAVGVRGACANPQTIIPTPKPPKPENQPKPESTPKLTPKSSNPDDYKKPGDDTTKDSGIGKKPIVPVVTTPAETTPPVVVKQKETEVRGGQVIVDTPTNKPGSETGVTAPGATPVPTTSGSNSSATPNNSSTIPTNEGGTNDGVVTDD